RGAAARAHDLRPGRGLPGGELAARARERRSRGQALRDDAHATHELPGGQAADPGPQGPDAAAHGGPLQPARLPRRPALLRLASARLDHRRTGRPPHVRFRATLLAVPLLGLAVAPALALAPVKAYKTTPDKLKLKFETLKLTATDSTRLDGWWFPGPPS